MCVGVVEEGRMVTQELKLKERLALFKLTADAMVKVTTWRERGRGCEEMTG